MTYNNSKPRKPRKDRQFDPKPWYYQPKYLKLRDNWYEKLADNGFIDLETRIPGVHLDCPILTEYASEVSQRAIQAHDALEDEYFRRVSSYLYSGTFKSELEREIWALHVQGSSFRQIAAQLASQGFTGASRMTCYRTVRQIRRRMEAEGTGREIELGSIEAVTDDMVRKLEVLREFAAFGEGFVTRTPWDKLTSPGEWDDE